MLVLFTLICEGSLEGSRSPNPPISQPAVRSLPTSPSAHSVNSALRKIRSSSQPAEAYLVITARTKVRHHQALYNQHLQVPHLNVENKALITPVDATLTQTHPVTPANATLTKTKGVAIALRSPTFFTSSTSFASPTRHARSSATPLPSSASEQFPSHTGWGVHLASQRLAPWFFFSLATRHSPPEECALHIPHGTKPLLPRLYRCGGDLHA